MNVGKDACLTSVYACPRFSRLESDRSSDMYQRRLPVKEPSPNISSSFRLLIFPPLLESDYIHIASSCLVDERSGFTDNRRIDHLPLKGKCPSALLARFAVRNYDPHGPLDLIGARSEDPLDDFHLIRMYALFPVEAQVSAANALLLERFAPFFASKGGAH